MLKVLLAGLLLFSTVSLAWGQVGSTTQKPEEAPVLRKPTDAQLAAAFSSEARASLEKAETMVLFSLDPSHKPTKPLPPENTFHGYRVLGQTNISSSQKTTLLAALYDGIARQLLATLCFQPRHGLRVQQGGKTVDLLICFSCGQMHVYEDNAKGRNVIISPSPRSAFNEALSKAGITIAP